MHTSEARIEQNKANISQTNVQTVRMIDDK
jgi:hypothetical protein